MLAHFGHAAIAELSPVSRIRRKLDFDPAKGSFWRAKQPFKRRLITVDVCRVARAISGLSQPVAGVTANTGAHDLAQGP